MASADIRWLQRLESFGRALAILQRALDLAAQRPLSELEEQGLIQSFAFCHELSWLLLKDYLADQGTSGISGSRDAVREALRVGLLPAGDEQAWLEMIRSRNLTSHTYNPDIARQIALLVQQRYAPAFAALHAVMQARAAGRKAP